MLVKQDILPPQERAAGRSVILGNITPANELLFGTRDDIMNICKKIIDELWFIRPSGVLHLVF